MPTTRALPDMADDIEKMIKQINRTPGIHEPDAIIIPTESGPVRVTRNGVERIPPEFYEGGEDD